MCINLISLPLGLCKKKSFLPRLKKDAFMYKVRKKLPLLFPFLLAPFEGNIEKFYFEREGERVRQREKERCRDAHRKTERKTLERAKEQHAY